MSDVYVLVDYQTGKPELRMGGETKWNTKTRMFTTRKPALNYAAKVGAEVIHVNIPEDRSQPPTAEWEPHGQA